MLTFSSLNCRGLNKKLKRKTIFNSCLNYDISCLQETYITDGKYKEWSLDWKGQLKYNPGTNQSKGLIILINDKLQHSILNVYNIKDRILGLKISINEVVYFVFNIYAPNSKNENMAFIDELYSVFNFTDSDNIIFCGDFNIVHNNNLDIISGEKHDISLVKKFQDWAINCEVTDTWRLMNPDLKDFS